MQQHHLKLIYGIHALSAIFEQHKETQLATLYVAQGKRNPKISMLIAMAEKAQIPIQTLANKELDRLSTNGNHQGIVAKLKNSNSSSKNQITNISTLLSFFETCNKPPLIVILDGVQDPHNLGAILRSADAAGADAVIAPQDNAVGLTPIVRKVACGAAETVPFIQVTNLARVLKKLKEHGIWLYGLDMHAEQTIYQTNFADGSGVGLVLGAEGTGLRRLTRELCDFLVEIPMHGTVQSLNVSVSAGITLFEVIRQSTKLLLTQPDLGTAK